MEFSQDSSLLPLLIILAEGMNEVLKIPVCSSAVVRTSANDPQTKKNRFKRYDNVKDIFQVKQPELLNGKHLLIIDDAITTGNTLESCIRIILEKCEGVQISLASLALAK